MKRTLFLVIAAFAAMSLSAADVTPAQAQAAANAFLTKQVASGHLKASSASNLQLVKAEKSVAKPTAVDYYIFNSAKSYVVVAGDDLAPQILMYGEKGALDLNNIPPAMQWLLNKYKYQIDGLKAGTMTPVKLPKFATTPVAPLVNANWDQSSPYNKQCPSNSVTGCPATSLAMCYYKWKWPETYPACAALSGTGGASAAALPTRDADWDNIIDEYTGPTNYSYTTDQANAVAWLMRYAGQSIPDYYYSSSASGANDPEIYQGCLNMGYTDAEYLLLTELVQSGWSYTNGPQQYTDAEWNEFMLNELHNGRPIEYLAYDVSYGYSVSGHAFNVFGCDANGKYFVNWGWSGDSNGYCTLHNFTTATGATGQAGSYVFNYGEAMIIGIEPPAGALTDPRITATPTTLTMNTIVGNPVTETFTVKGYNLTGDVNLTVTGGNAFSLSTTSISAAQAQAQGGVTVTVTYNPVNPGSHEATVMLTSEGAENVNVKINGTADLETYDPVMLEAGNITSTSFKATWTDETPAENVESYTLYVSAEPFLPPFALLDTTDWTSNNNVPAGWTASGLNYYGSNNACYLSSYGNSYVKSKTYDLTGYDKVTVMVYTEPYGNSNTMTVATSVDSKTINLSGSSFYWVTFVLNCASSDYVKLTTTGLPDMRYMKVYAGDLSAAMQIKASETGDENYRMITGITGKSYTVTNLAENGHFYFYVVANYTDGGACDSNTEEVTLFAGTSNIGDVNGNGSIDISDATLLIDYLLNGDSTGINMENADCNQNGVVDISDVTTLINYLLNGVW
ncbi:MAG: C10 family peptidase [Muribaculaceae bacterium]|nr:C10 family peptidase [Muribaculaceae bacterium]